jgi:hypothetical protein
MRSNSKSVAATAKSLMALFCIALLLPGEAFANAGIPPQAPAPEAASSRIPADQLDSLVAPVALYPDPLLAQTLAASTYPLEIVQLQQWLAANQDLKESALAAAVARQPWDPSVQALAGLPEVVNRLANNIQWTTDLGNAFLVQQGDVMEAVQRMRRKATDKGTLKSTAQQQVETRTFEDRDVIVIEQANPRVIYVPSYDPFWVWGPPVYYPYPAIYYPSWGYYYPAGLAISFGVGVVMGSFWSGGWGWGCGWGHHDIYVNHYSRFYNDHYHGGYATPDGYRSAAGRSSWQHNPQHRGGTAYSDRSTATRFGGTTRNDSRSNRQSIARQQINRQNGNVASYRANGTPTRSRSAGSSVSASNYGSGINSRTAGRQAGNRVSETAAVNRAYGNSASSRAIGSGVSTRTYGSGVGTRGYSRAGSSSAGVRPSGNVRSYSPSRSYGGGNRSVYGGSARASSGSGSRGYSAPSARAGSSRGSSGGVSRGGGARSSGGGRR